MTDNNKKNTLDKLEELTHFLLKVNEDHDLDFSEFVARDAKLANTLWNNVSKEGVDYRFTFMYQYVRFNEETQMHDEMEFECIVSFDGTKFKVFVDQYEITKSFEIGKVDTKDFFEEFKSSCSLAFDTNILQNS